MVKRKKPHEERSLPGPNFLLPFSINLMIRINLSNPKSIKDEIEWAASQENLSETEAYRLLIFENYGAKNKFDFMKNFRKKHPHEIKKIERGIMKLLDKDMGIENENDRSKVYREKAIKKFLKNKRVKNGKQI
jgi:hypothetical protein